MTSLLYKAVRFVAPNQCILCSKEDNTACAACLASLPGLEGGFCCLCGAPGASWEICGNCRDGSGLDWLQASFEYAGSVRELIHRLKFQRCRDVAAVLGARLAGDLPFLDGWYVAAVPTSPKRVRQRGYDQAVLLAKQVALQKSLPCASLLGRLSDGRQARANRARRSSQASNMFYVINPAKVLGKKILLVDDVCTTGATLNSAAESLLAAGAAGVAAAVIAWKR